MRPSSLTYLYRFRPRNSKIYILPETFITFTGRAAVDDFYPYRPLTFASASLDTSMQQCRTVFYTPPVAASVARIEKQVLTLFAAFSYLVEAANQRHQGTEEFLVTRRFSPLIELLIVDEANRLRDASLELSFKVIPGAFLSDNLPILA